MNKDEIKEKLKTGMDKVVESSKKAFGKAGTAVQKFSDQSVTRIEIKQYESKRKAELTKLGELAADRFYDNGDAVLGASEEQVVNIINSIKEIDSRIASRQAELDAAATASQEESKTE